MNTNTFKKGIWVIDFEFHPINSVEGNPPRPVCLVAHRWPDGPTYRYWQDELDQMQEAPFPTDTDALCVAYYATAELDCFLSLKWPLPSNVLDLYVEFRNLTNGNPLPSGNGLIGAMQYFGLPTMECSEKSAMRDLVLSAGPWNASDTLSIQSYCESDVLALAKLLDAMEPYVDLPRALYRGRYMKAVSRMQETGTPIDHTTFKELTKHWSDIQDKLIEEIDRDYQVFEGRTFKRDRWERFLLKNEIPWPRLESGQLNLSDDTFRQMAKSHPIVSPMRELRSSLSEMRLGSLRVGEDSRNRCLLSPFRSKTGRNQPSNSAFIFGTSTWLRGLIKPTEGYALAYIDWSQQEFGIAAALSGDKSMKAAYNSGDPYLAFAKQAGAVPENATKQSHKAEREQFKACVLAVQYGMGEQSLAEQINQPVARARQLLNLHRQTYKTFWRWSDDAVNEAGLRKSLWTSFNWRVNSSNDFNDRSLRNFPMQANGAEMLRLACIDLTESGIRVCAPVHDALLIEAPINEINETIETTQLIMRRASSTALGGFELNSEAKIVAYPDRYMDERGERMWNAVMEILNREKEVPSS